MKAVALLALALWSQAAFADDVKTLLRTKLPADYESRSGCAKADFLWNERIVPTAYDKTALPPLVRIDPSALAGLATLPTFNRVSDEFASPRQKLFHAFGSVAKIKFVPAQGSPYTGLLQGACGLMRLSLAADPTVVGFVPGGAVKLFVDGQPSENLQFLGSLDPQKERNFFQETFRNQLPEPSSAFFKTVVRLVGVTGLDPLFVSVRPFFRVDAQGAKPAAPVEAEVLEFEPSDALRALRVGEDRDVRTDLADIPAGTEVYSVYGKAKGAADRTFAGTVVLETEIVASAYGDRKLFFKHNQEKAD